MNYGLNRNDFMAYINNLMDKDDIIMLYNENNIKYEKCELYSDFTQSLIMLVFDTYLGDDVTDVIGQAGHFNWCWNKNISNFGKEGLFFDCDLLFEYFLEFMMEVFYSSNEKDRMNFTDKDKGILKLWLDIFDYTKLKTNSDMDALIEVYKIFEMSLKVV